MSREGGLSNDEVGRLLDAIGTVQPSWAESLLIQLAQAAGWVIGSLPLLGLLAIVGVPVAWLALVAKDATPAWLRPYLPLLVVGAMTAAGWSAYLMWAKP
jgi:hypothetical protein